MNHRMIKLSFTCGLLVALFLSAVVVSKPAEALLQSQQEKEKAEWVKIAKEFFDFKVPKGYEVVLPEGAGGGGEIFINFDLYPKSGKSKNEKIMLAVYLAGHATIAEYVGFSKEYGAKDLGPVTLNGKKWHRFVPEGKVASQHECHGFIKGDKLFEFCVDASANLSGKLIKAYKTFLKSVKIK